jgi:quercetin dioxygenase-like cupin family protein
MKPVTILKVDRVKRLDRGGGITTLPLITPQSADHPVFSTGISTYPKGKGAPMHSHNCPEQVTLLDGVGEVEIDGVVTPLSKYDSTYIPGDIQHAFRNTGDGPMTILWIYGATRVTRTFAATGETVEHLSAADLMSASK